MWRRRASSGSVAIGVVGSLVSLASLAVGALLVSSCKDSPTATIGITTGLETDAFTRAPAPTTLIVDDIDLDGGVTQLAVTSLPADQISLGDQDVSAVGSFRVTANDATGKTLLRGESLPVQFGALNGASVSVFVQRTGELARFPNASAPLDAPQLGVSGSRYLLAASGTSTFLYDLFELATAASFAPLPRPAKSMAIFASAAVIIDENGASTLDLSDGTTSDLTAPAGATFADVAGGAAILTTQSAFVVGGTRTTTATATVFTVAASGDVAFATLAVARLGACATYVDGRGVFVYGGGGTDSAAELLPDAATVGTKLPYPADPVKGCGAAALDGTHVLVVGGVGTPTDPNAVAPSRVFDLSCTANCVPTVWTGALPLVRAEAFVLGSNAAFVSGDDATGATRAFRITSTAAVELPLKEARRNARIIPMPITGAVAIVGGGSSVEQYLE